MWLTIYAQQGDVVYPPCKYLYYTKREAIKRYREQHGLVGKRLTITCLKT